MTKQINYADWIIIAVLALLVVGLFAFDCFGMHPSTCRILVKTKTGQNEGTGTLLDLTTPKGRPVIASCAHIFAGARSRELTLTFGTKRVNARLMWLSAKRDVSFIYVNTASVKGIPRTPIADSMPGLNEPVSTEGYGYQGPGYANGLVKSLRETVNSVPILTTSATVIEGDSGGPIRNRKGQLVSIVKGRGGDNVSHGIRTDYLWKSAQDAGLRRIFPNRQPCPPGVSCPPQQYQIETYPTAPPVVTEPVFEAPQYVQPQVQPQVVQPQVIRQEVIPVVPQQIIPRQQVEVIVTQKPGDRGPPGVRGPQGPPGASPQVDYQRLAQEVAPLISINEQDLVQKITEAVLANTKPEKFPDAMRVNIYDKMTGETLFDETYPLRGSGGVVDIKVPYERSNIGNRSGQFQIQVQ